MLIKAGVDISRLKPEIRNKLSVIAGIVEAIENEELVITSTYEGNHTPGSKHYADLAVDIRIFKKAALVKQEIVRTLGEDYFIYLGKHCIHIGWDPKS